MREASRGATRAASGPPRPGGPAPAVRPLSVKFHPSSNKEAARGIKYERAGRGAREANRGATRTAGGPPRPGWPAPTASPLNKKIHLPSNKEAARAAKSNKEAARATEREQPPPRPHGPAGRAAARENARGTRAPPAGVRPGAAAAGTTARRGGGAR